MKKILFIFSILTLLSYGCNRDQGAGAGSGGMKQEEQSRDGTGSVPESSPSNSDMSGQDASSNNNQ